MMVPSFDPRTPRIPRFALYGEPPRSVPQHFVHVESLDERSRPNEWIIQPHTHTELSHVFLLRTGAGAMQVEADVTTFETPCLLLVPGGVVHGFRWAPESSGTVITLGLATLDVLTSRDDDLALLSAAPRVVPLDKGAALRVDAWCTDLATEVCGAQPGCRTAANAALGSIVVTALRYAGSFVDAPAHRSRHAAVVAHLRERIEQRFALRESVADYARSLGVSVTRLRVACAQAAGTSPGALLDERALLEARRALLHSNLSVAEIGYAIGFEDPAYFSRFFTRHVGVSPRRYRERSGS